MICVKMSIVGLYYALTARGRKVVSSGFCCSVVGEVLQESLGQDCVSDDGGRKKQEEAGNSQRGKFRGQEGTQPKKEKVSGIVCRYHCFAIGCVCNTLALYHLLFILVHSTKCLALVLTWR